MTSFSVWWRHMTRKEEIRNIAIKTLFINVQKAATYQNVRIDSVYLLHTQILRYDIILTSLWRHFRVWYKWRHCDVIFGQKNLEKIMEIAELKSFISYAGFFSSISSRKKVTAIFNFQKQPGSHRPPPPLPIFLGPRFLGHPIPNFGRFFCIRTGLNSCSLAKKAGSEIAGFSEKIRKILGGGSVRPPPPW